MLENHFISIIIPCRNEEKYIEGVINNILDQDYPQDRIEAIFIDGMSTDNTIEIIKNYQIKNNNLKLIKNKDIYVQYAMNIGIKASRGKFIIILGAHSSYPNNYVSKLVDWIEKLDADVVGGSCLTYRSSESIKAKAIAISLSSPFGVGNSYFRIGITEPMKVDTVPYGCYKTEVFEKAGLFNEHLIRNQDIELNKRIIQNGGSIYLVPDVKSVYHARDNYKNFISNNFKNGLWTLMTPYYTKTLGSLSLRHFIPLFFILYLISVPLILLFTTLIFLPISLYAILLIYFSIKALKKEEKINLFLLLILSIIILHLSYGFGSLYGIFKIILLKTKISVNF